jgi:hypothetical protein
MNSRLPTPEALLKSLESYTPNTHRTHKLDPYVLSVKLAINKGMSYRAMARYFTEMGLPIQPIEVSNYIKSRGLKSLASVPSKPPMTQEDAMALRFKGLQPLPAR